MKTSTIMGIFIQQIKLATKSGLKGHDDCLDTISMLGYLNPWKPSETMILNAQGESIYEEDDFNKEEYSALSSYIV